MKAVDVLELFFALFQKEVLGTKRKLLLRLIISEGPRFPALAEFYYREVVSQRAEADARGGAQRASPAASSPATPPRAFPS